MEELTAGVTDDVTAGVATGVMEGGVEGKTGDGRGMTGFEDDGPTLRRRTGKAEKSEVVGCGK